MWPQTAVYADVQPADVFTANLKVLSHEKGTDRTPPNLHDLDIYYPTPAAFPFAPTPPETKRHDVPFVPGAFVMSDVVTPKECRMIMGLAEAAGFVPDQPANTDRKLAASTEAGLGTHLQHFILNFPLVGVVFVRSLFALVAGCLNYNMMEMDR